MFEGSFNRLPPRAGEECIGGDISESRCAQETVLCGLLALEAAVLADMPWPAAGSARRVPGRPSGTGDIQ
jgi:hypothetical protein